MKWISSDREVLETIPEPERAQTIKEISLQHIVERVLCVQWRVNTNTFGFDVNVKERPPMQRGILSIIGSVFDPFGFAAPFVLTAKKILQDLCKMKLGWYEEIPPEYNVRWQKWLVDLPMLSKLPINHCFKLANFGTIAYSQLHHFSDTSEIGFGSVSYLGLVDINDRVHCAILQGKSWLAPLKKFTIPRLELSAATVSMQSDKAIKRELELPLTEPSVFWTDSTSVLRYVNNEDKGFHTFLANRIAIIRDGSDPNQWRYVSGESNPGDDLSRGLSAEILLDRERWIKGAQFLWMRMEVWPRNPTMLDSIPDTDPEVKQEANSFMSSAKEPFGPLAKYFQHTSSWYRLKKSVAWFLRYCEKLQSASKGEKPRKSHAGTILSISVEEMRAAELEILKAIQRHHFPEERRSLTRCGSTVKKSSCLQSLDPILVYSLLRVKGRLRPAQASFDSKNQIILPKNDHVSNLLIEHFHLISGHSSREYILSLLRERFWVIKGSCAVRRILSKCVSCHRRQAPVLEQKMADLPEDRLTPDQPPFTAVGVDCFGPFHIRHPRSLAKQHGIIFTCLAICTVHIKVVHSLETESFLLALGRFKARRGQVKEIRSDNGTNFTAGERELRRSIRVWNQERIHESLLQKDIKWTFNPPYGSHHGGVWERCIRTTQKILNALLKQQTLDDEALVTLMCAVESIINGRPITKVSEDAKDLEPLTPNHLLLLKSGSVLPPGTFSCRRWRQVQYMADQF